MAQSSGTASNLYVNGRGNVSIPGFFGGSPELSPILPREPEENALQEVSSEFYDSLEYDPEFYDSLEYGPEYDLTPEYFSLPEGNEDWSPMFNVTPPRAPEQSSEKVSSQFYDSLEPERYVSPRERARNITSAGKSLPLRLPQERTQALNTTESRYVRSSFPIVKGYIPKARFSPLRAPEQYGRKVSSQFYDSFEPERYVSPRKRARNITPAGKSLTLGEPLREVSPRTYDIRKHHTMPIIYVQEKKTTNSSPVRAIVSPRVRSPLLRGPVRELSPRTYDTHKHHTMPAGGPVQEVSPRTYDSRKHHTMPVIYVQEKKTTSSSPIRTVLPSRARSLLLQGPVREFSPGMYTTRKYHTMPEFYKKKDVPTYLPVRKVDSPKIRSRMKCVCEQRRQEEENENLSQNEVIAVPGPSHRHSPLLARNMPEKFIQETSPERYYSRNYQDEHESSRDERKEISFLNMLSPVRGDEVYEKSEPEISPHLPDSPEYSSEPGTPNGRKIYDEYYDADWDKTQTPIHFQESITSSPKLIKPFREPGDPVPINWRIRPLFEGRPKYKIPFRNVIYVREAEPADSKIPSVGRSQLREVNENENFCIRREDERKEEAAARYLSPKQQYEPPKNDRMERDKVWSEVHQWVQEEAKKRIISPRNQVESRINDRMDSEKIWADVHQWVQEEEAKKPKIQERYNTRKYPATSNLPRLFDKEKCVNQKKKERILISPFKLHSYPKQKFVPLRDEEHSSIDWGDARTPSPFRVHSPNARSSPVRGPEEPVVILDPPEYSPEPECYVHPLEYVRMLDIEKMFSPLKGDVSPEEYVSKIPSPPVKCICEQPRQEARDEHLSQDEIIAVPGPSHRYPPLLTQRQLNIPREPVNETNSQVEISSQQDTERQRQQDIERERQLEWKNNRTYTVAEESFSFSELAPPEIDESYVRSRWLPEDKSNFDLVDIFSPRNYSLLATLEDESSENEEEWWKWWKKVRPKCWEQPKTPEKDFILPEMFSPIGVKAICEIQRRKAEEDNRNKMNAVSGPSYRSPPLLTPRQLSDRFRLKGNETEIHETPIRRYRKIGFRNYDEDDRRKKNVSATAKGKDRKGFNVRKFYLEDNEERSPIKPTSRQRKSESDDEDFCDHV